MRSERWAKGRWVRLGSGPTGQVRRPDFILIAVESKKGSHGAVRQSV